MLSILLVYPFNRTRRALNLLRASFSPIFQYFSAVNVTRVSFSPVFQYFVTYVYAHARTYIRYIYIRMPCATELFDVRHGFFGPEGRVLNKGRRDSLSTDLRIEKEQGRVADRRLRRKGSRRRFADRSRRVSQYMYNYNNYFVKIYSHVKL